jgi:pyridoxine 5-phosphate synthase
MDIGLGINAGHDLDQANLPLFATLPGLQEVSIGHAIICESLQSGFEPTIRAYVDILN